MAPASKVCGWSGVLVVFAFLGFLATTVDTPTGGLSPDLVRHFADVDAQLSHARGRMAFLARINPRPESVARERRRFFAARHQGGAYNPRFEYPALTFSPGELSHGLLRLSVPQGPLGDIYRQLRWELLQRLECLTLRGTRAFASCAEELYGRPSPELVERARALLASLPPADLDTGPALGTAEVAKVLARRLKVERLTGWSVLPRRRIAARAAVVSSRQAVLIRPAKKTSARQVARLEVHEIGTHVRRAVAGERYGLRIFARGLPGYLPTEEGLAIVREERAGLLGADELRRYAARVLAVELARRASFAQVFDTLVGYGVPENEAFEITLRAKRGLAETGEPGAFPKDYVYLYGKLLVAEHLARGGEIEELLRAGKIGIQHLGLLRGEADS